MPFNHFRTEYVDNDMHGFIDVRLAFCRGYEN